MTPDKDVQSPFGVLAVRGESSETVRGVRRLLALPDSDLFDEPLEQRLRGFQTVAGLVPNGWLTELTYHRLRNVKGVSDDRGEATLTMAMAGSVLTGSPLIVALASTESLANGTAFTISLLVGLLTIGLGAGKIYKAWKAGVEADILHIENDRKHAQVLTDLCAKFENVMEQVERIESRQLALKTKIDQIAKDKGV
jgi:hypothetical protein